MRSIYLYSQQNGQFDGNRKVKRKVFVCLLMANLAERRTKKKNFACQFHIHFMLLEPLFLRALLIAHAASILSYEYVATCSWHACFFVRSLCYISNNIRISCKQKNRQTDRHASNAKTTQFISDLSSCLYLLYTSVPQRQKMPNIFRRS